MTQWIQAVCFLQRVFGLSLTDRLRSSVILECLIQSKTSVQTHDTLRECQVLIGNVVALVTQQKQEQESESS